MGINRLENQDRRTRWEKFQDSSRDIFVFLFILIVFVIPTFYIGIRAFQSMTVQGYEGMTFTEYMKDQFTHHLDEDAQQVALLKILVTPYKAGIDVLFQLFPQLGRSVENPNSFLVLSEIPNAWWNGIQKESVIIFQTIKSLYPEDYQD